MVKGNKATHIVWANIEVHKLEAPVYDIQHMEIFNKFEQRRLEITLCKLFRTSRNLTYCLDVGCGTGNLLLKLASHCLNVNGHAVGLDISIHMLHKLKSKLSKLGLNNCVDVVLCNAQALPFREEIFNMVGFYSVLHHVPNPDIALVEVHKVLAKDGILLIDHEPNSKRVRRFADLLYTFYVLTKLARFSHEKRLNVDHTLSDFWAEKGFEENDIRAILRSYGFGIINISYHFIYTLALIPKPFNAFSIIFNLMDKIPVLKKFANCITITASKV